MKWIQYLALTLCFILFPSLVKADCSYERQAELSRIAGNVQFSYSYEVDEQQVKFHVIASNITDDIYVIDTLSDSVVVNDKYMKHFAGETVSYDIFANDINCKGEKIITKSISLPSYNSFSNSSDCSEHPNFKYCQIWLNTANLTQEEFKDELAVYLTKEKTSLNNNEVEEGFWSAIKDNVFFIVICIIGLIILPILLYFKRRV